MRLFIHLLLLLALALFVSLPATAQGITDRLEDAKQRVEEVKSDLEDDDKEDEDKEDDDKEDKDKEDDDKEDKDKEDDDKEDKED